MKDSSKSLLVIFREKLPNMHQKGVNRIKSHNESLYTAGRDGIIRQWNMRSLSLENCYTNHVHWVNDIELSDSLLFSASSDSRILVWNRNHEDLHPKPAESILAHKDYIHSLKLIGDSLYSAGEDGVVIKTNPDYRSQMFQSFPISIWN